MCLRNQFPAIINVTKTCEKHLNGDEEALKALVAVQPIVVGFSVTIDFMYYKDGIFNDPTCTTAIDHAMVEIKTVLKANDNKYFLQVVVGYGTDKKTKKDYWIVRNSWSKTWGRWGYGLVARNAGNMCGIASWAMWIPKKGTTC